MLPKLLVAFAVIYAASAETQNWNVTNKQSGKTCIIVRADPVVKVNFGNGNVYTVNIESNTGFDGDCNTIWKNQSAQVLNVNFRPDPKVPATSAQLWKLSLYFGPDEKNVAFKLIDYSLMTAHVSSMNGSVPRLFGMDSAATNDVSAKKSTDAYRCTSTVLALENNSSITMNKFHVLAEALADKSTFVPEQVFENCAADAQTSDVVPIIVGACLAGLVVIVLVAYLIGRARAKRQGYASV